MKKKQLTVREMYYPHFAKRLSERYGMIATQRLYDDIIRQIQNNNKHTRVMRTNRQRSIHCVWINGQRVYVVYRKRLGKTNALVTALPPSRYLRLLYEREKEAVEQGF